MALSQQARQAIAIRNKAKAKPANDDAPKAPRQRLVLPDVVATLFAQEIKIADTTDGKPYMAMRGCEVTLANGTRATRTVMVFDEAYDAVSGVIAAHKDVVATLAHNGSTLRVIGLEIDGEMRMFEQKVQTPKAA